MVAVLSLAISLIISPLTFDLTLRKLKGTPLTLFSEGRNLSLSIHQNGLYADNQYIGQLALDSSQSVAIECLTDASLHISIENTSSLLNSPSLCTSASALHIDETSLNGCIENVFQGGILLLERLCSDGDGSSEEEIPRDQSSQSDSDQRLSSLRMIQDHSYKAPLQPVYIAEPLQVNEGASMPLQWKNVYILPEHTRLNISNDEIIFSVIEGPRHGLLLVGEDRISSFNYAHLLARNVVYKHDGSETREDHFDFQMEFPKRVSLELEWMESTVYTLKIKINPVNDPPELSDSMSGALVKVSANRSRALTSDILRLNDVDDSPDMVRVQVIEGKGAHVSVEERTVSEFTQRQLLNGQVRVVDEGVSDHSLIRLVARDSESRSSVISLQLVSVPIGVQSEFNTGLRLLHHGSSTITKQNLSFAASVPELPLHYRIVGLPEHGVVECSPPNGHFHVCTTFSQSQVDSGLVRFRHTGSGSPTHDSFSFQVESGDFVSMVYSFRLNFIPMNIKVFNREVFLLNGSEMGVLERINLFAWTFPKSYSSDKLIYHIIEPPKYGILSRKIGARNRRIGVSSNFTQLDIDGGLISYKLHFMQYSILNDYFLFKIISPSIQSETQRFEIIFLPSPASIHLVNRTVIVDEGSITQITSDFLSLSTPDDKHFIFLISIPPQHGSLTLKDAKGEFRSLESSHNFTTTHINEGRLYYNHSGSESRQDRVNLLAESAFRGGTRIPLSLSFSIILHNDHPPRLIGSDTIYMEPKGDRILHGYLLEWADEDQDSIPLMFSFPSSSKDGSIMSSRSPHLNILSFSQDDLSKGMIIIRHFGNKPNFSLQYTVSDGLHSVPGILRVISREPFIEMENAELVYCCQAGDRPEIEIDRGNLSVRTNLDVNLDQIIYTTPSQHFKIKRNGTARITSKFTQLDINEKVLYYTIHYAKKEPLTIHIRDQKIQTEMNLTLRSLGASLELRRSQALSVTVGGAIIINNETLLQSDGVTQSGQLVYTIIKHPTQGHLVLDDGSTYVSSFTQFDVDTGRLQYLHTGRSAGRDSFSLQIRSPHGIKGPYTIYVDIYEHHVDLKTSPIQMVSGGSAVLSPMIIGVSSSDKDDYNLKIVSPPRFGSIVRDRWILTNISAIDSFTGNELRERRIVYVSDKNANAAKDTFQIMACISGNTCTNAHPVEILISQQNKQSPLLIRNEVLRVTSADFAMLTNSHLGTEDADTPSDQVSFLISKPSNGFMARISQPELSIYNFSQREIDDGLIVFYKNQNVSFGSGGFSFLLSDGIHQVGPEWFTIETWDSQVNVELEVNSRLTCAPDVNAIISVDLLRANIPAVAANDIIFSVLKAPKYGKLMVNGIESHRFTQSDINRRLVSYKVSSMEHPTWSRRDSFLFTVSTSNNFKPSSDEHRFRISSTYAALGPELLREFATTNALYLSKGGSTALNQTHLNLEKLSARVSNEVLLMEIAKQPRNGDTEWLDVERNVLSWVDFFKGWPLIYRHSGETDRDDELVVFVYPVSESTRSASRIRITIPIRILSIRDPSLEIAYFPRSISCVSGGATSLDQTQFFAKHPTVPAPSIIYQIVQNGRNGARVRVSHRGREMFSQEELNQGLVSIVHTPLQSGSALSDVIVFSIEGIYRALIIKIRPLDLALENHTTIHYPQGKTYVVLSRSHLGAFSNGDRRKTSYKIVVPPENGTFYWVAGEKEAKEFTQDDIDNGRVLYAQLNMHSFKDSFEFMVSNEGRDTVRNRSEIVVKSLVIPQPVIVEANTTTPITSSQLNASALEGSSPRFLVAAAPKYGRVTLDPQSSHSALFFTNNDIAKGRVMYQAFGSRDEVTENLVLEVRADSVQPARLILPITILPSEDSENGNLDRSHSRKNGGIDEDNMIDGDAEKSFPKLVKPDYLLHISLLAAIVLIVIVIMICRFRSASKKKQRKKSIKLDEAGETDMLATPRLSLERPDLLGTTVFATVRSSETGQLLEAHKRELEEKAARAPLRTFEGGKPRASLPSPTHRSGQTPRAQRRHAPSLDYAGLANDTPPAMPLFQQLSKPTGDTQHWV